METHRLFKCCLNYANRDNKNTNFNLYWCFALQFLQNFCCHCIVYLLFVFYHMISFNKVLLYKLNFYGVQPRYNVIVDDT